MVLFSAFLVFVLTSCGNQQAILTNVNERSANQIIVLLESRGINSKKEPVKTSGGATETAESMWDIFVDSSRSIEALAILNRIGLPRKAGVSLLDIFPQQGMMKTDKEEQIRYNEGLNEQLASTIEMIDGVLAAEVQIAFPEVDNFNPDQQTELPRASVFVKHDGILSDPNNLLTQKIRRYIAGSVLNLQYEDVTVVTDRARFTDISADAFEPKTPATPWGNQEYIKIWNIIVSEQSASAFRTILFIFCLFMIIISVALGWTLWKFQNFFKNKEQLKHFISTHPIAAPLQITEEIPPESPTDDEDSSNQ
ncbi:MAG: hypothetical protein S4CHLAM7_08400 [Chlamydiae bacterium]|nr:hypothetical protein [Chlamydiota bacterium]